MKKYSIFLLLGLLIILCVSCLNRSRKIEDKNFTKNDIKKISESKIKGNYITFTVTYEKEEEKYYSKNYVYDLETKKVELMGEVECNAGYAVTAYDKWDKVIYYAHRGMEKDNQFTQIYGHYVETGEDFPITDTLCAINYIIPLEDYIFVGSGDRGAVQEKIYAHKILKEGKEVQTLFDIEDYQMDNVKYNPDLKNFYLVGQSYSYYNNFILGSDVEDNVRTQQINYTVDTEGNIVSHNKISDLRGPGVYLENDNYTIYHLRVGERKNDDLYTYLVNKEKNESKDLTGEILFKSLIYIDSQNNLYYIGFDERDEESLVRLNLDTWESEVIFQIEEGDFGIDNGFVTG